MRRDDEMQIIDIDIDSIIIGESRYRKDMGDVGSLADSIEALGLLIPIIITEDNKLIAGERRIKAMKSKGMKTIKAMVFTASEIDRKIFEITENLERKDFTWQERVLAIDDLHQMFKASKKKWSERKTAKEIGLASGGVITDLNLAEAVKMDPEMFKNCKSKQAALKVLQRFNIDEAVSELHLRKSRTNYGRKAEQYVFCGDCTVLIDNLPKSIVDFVISDPFYGLDIQDVKKDETYLDFRVYEDSAESYKSTMTTLIQKLDRVLKPDSGVLLFCALTSRFGDKNFEWLREELQKIGIKSDWMPGIWHRPGSPGQTLQPTHLMARSYEVFVYGFRGNACLQKQGLSNVLSFANISPLDRQHPVQKPFGLMEEIITRLCLPGMVVLDPFAGAGTTVMAALKLGCQPIAFEIDKNYYQLLVLNVAEALKMKDGNMADRIGRNL